MTFLGTASAWLDTTFETSDGETVTYRRGSATVSVTAVFGAAPAAQQDLNGAVIAWQGVEFYIAAADLLLGGTAIKPEIGDEITHGSVLYRVAKSDIDGREWVYADEATRTMLRVRAVRFSRSS